MKKIKEQLRKNSTLHFLYSKYIDCKAHQLYKKRTKENKIHVYSIEETIKKIVADRSSIVRFGDGELAIIIGKEISFQKYDSKLSKSLENILRSKEPGLLVGIPDIFEGLDLYTKKDITYWERNLMDTYGIWNRVIKSGNYYNAFVTRPYMIFEDKKQSAKYFEMFFELYSNREVVLVEGEQSRLGCGNDLFKNVTKLERILCPTKNAYDKYDEILMEIKKQPKKKLILLSLGPTAKLLAYDLYKIGYQVLDIGHIDLEYEWYLRGAKEKIKIDNKFVNEARDQNQDIKKTFDEKYENEIIAKVI
jgi:glycosyltransferase, SP_1767 family